MIYVIGGMKYGVAKTTAAVNLALYLARVKYKDVLLVDADPSERSSEFMNLRGQSIYEKRLTCVKVNGDSIQTELSKLKSQFEHIIIDSGYGDNLTSSLMMVGPSLLSCCGISTSIRNLTSYHTKTGCKILLHVYSVRNFSKK